MTDKAFLLAEVKQASEEGPGTFEAIVSAPTVDRDGEVIKVGAFEPLPDSVPVHAFHNFNEPVARGVPSYEGDVLMLRGTFASTPRAQEIRTLVADGIIGHMSVGFMGADRKDEDGTPLITSAELLEVSFVSVPSNREAAILAVKAYEQRSGARNSGEDAGRLQQIHDLAVSNGAECKGLHEATPKSVDTDPEPPAVEAAAVEAAAETAGAPAQVLTTVARAYAAIAAALNA